MPLVAVVPLLFIGAYLLGGIPFGLLVGRVKGIDIRRHGSGNVGATNVWRVLGSRWGLFVFVLDLGKGTVTTIVAGLLLRGTDMSAALRDLIWMGAGSCCIVGSMAPVYLGFRGGKGVAASLGAALGLYPYLTWPGAASFCIWAAVSKLSGYVSLGSITAAISLPVAFVIFAFWAHWSMAEHYPLLALTVAMAILVVSRHRANIGRLLAGTENRRGAR